MTRKKKIFLGIVVFLLLLQIIRIDKTTPMSNPSDDLFAVESVPASTKTMIKNACYDCHSHETEYPWYSNIAPISLFLRGHIKGGRQTVNFSEWGKYEKDKRRHYLEEIVEVIENRRMPMKSYVFMHGDASLSDEQRKEIVNWARGAKQ